MFLTATRLRVSVSAHADATRLHVSVHANVYVWVYVCMYVCIHTYVHVWVYVGIYPHANVRVGRAGELSQRQHLGPICMYIYTAYMYVCMHVCMYVCIHI